MINEGIINLNKPRGMTSHGCVQAIRRITKIKRVGHTGTLDPQAEGVLPVCIGSAARVMEYLDLDFKKYRAEMILGLTTETQDIWGEPIKDVREDLARGRGISHDMIIEAFASFKALTEQTPPKYSALKVNGRKLYEYARAGESVEIKKRKVYIEDISINKTDIEGYKISFDVTCSKGTYIRSICSDAGELLGCGGAMSGLVRLASGVFTLEDAVSLEYLADLNEEELNRFVKPADYPLVHFGRAFIQGVETAARFMNGGPLSLDEVIIEAEPEYAAKEHPITVREEYKRAYNMYAGQDGERVFIGVAFYDEGRERLSADKVFYHGGNK